MAGAAGAIIVRDDDSNIHWRKKCEACGYVEPGTHVSTRPSQHSMVNHGAFFCPECRHQSDVIIFG